MTDAAAPDPAGGGDAAHALGALLRLQDVDTAISQLEHRRISLPVRSALADLTAALASSDRRVGELQGARDELLQRQGALEQQVAATEARRRSIEQRMYAARGAASRDLQAMDEEIRLLAQRGEEMEDAELELMVALEPLDAELATLEAERARLQDEASTARRALHDAEAEIDGELAVQRAARESVAADVPADLRQRYDSLRARLGGTGAARLVGNRCSGCHLELPSMEVDRIHRLPPGAVVTCEQCGRILVAQAGSGDAA